MSLINQEDPKELQNKDISDVVFKNSVIDLVKKEFDRRHKERIPLELQWNLNINFLSGNQYCDINIPNQSITEIPKAYKWQMREVFNHIAPIVETRLAKLTKINPSLMVRPATQERQDIATAKTCTALVKGTYNKLEMKNQIKYANAWAEQCGTVFHKQTWDNSKGRKIGMLEQETISEGDVCADVIPPYEIFPDSLYSADVDVCQSLIHARAYHVDVIEQRWGKKLKGREIDVFALNNTKIGTGGLGYTATVQKVITSKKKDHEVVVEYYEKPNIKFPNGRLIIIAGDELLHYDEMPYNLGEDGEKKYPFVRQVCIYKPGQFFGGTVIERCIPIQRSFNALKNRKYEYLNRIAIGNLTVEDGTVDLEDIEEEGLYPGKVIVHSRGSRPPSPLQNGVLPQEFIEEENKLITEFERISGVSDLSLKSGVPTGAGSGISLEILQEQDDTRLSLTAEHIREAVTKIGRQWLGLYKQFAIGTRVLRFVGRNNDVQVMEWTQNDITSFDVVLEAENELASSPAQRKQMVFDLLNAGLFNDPNTGNIDSRMRAKILEMLELGNFESATDLTDLHVSRAMRENIFLEQGQVPQLQNYDDDTIHILEHDKYRLGADFEQIAAQNPQIALILDAHVNQHRASISYKMAALMPQQNTENKE